MLLEKNVVGNQEDWAQYITSIDEHETPLLARIPKGSKPVNILYNYQVDAYEEPKPVAWPDGKDWDTFKTAGANRAELKARAQWFVDTCAVSKLAQDVSNAAGVADEMAREVKKKLKEMGRIIEATFCSDQEAAEDNGTTGNQTRGIGKWIQATAQAVYPVPTAFLTPAASIYSDTKANLVENAIRAVLESQWRMSGNASRTRTALVGPSLKTRFSTFPLYVPTDLATQSTARVTNRNQGDKRFGGSVGYYDSDFGSLELIPTKWNAHPNFGGSIGKSDWRGYILDMAMWELRWNQKPKVYKPEFKGGSYTCAIDAICMLVCKNPMGEAKIAPSDA